MALVISCYHMLSVIWTLLLTHPQLFERAKRDGVDVVPLDREQQLLASPLCVRDWAGELRRGAH